MIRIPDFIQSFPAVLRQHQHMQPWEITDHLKTILQQLIGQLDVDYKIRDGIAIHRDAVIEDGVVLKGPLIIRSGCFVGAHAYFREGGFIDERVKIGPGCEIKASIICSNTAIAHFNYIGNSIIGSDVNFEAGAIAANHYNERTEKRIRVSDGTTIIDTQTEKFGSLVGDRSKIGANAVLSPGTILLPGSIVKRLELIDQVSMPED